MEEYVTITCSLCCGLPVKGQTTITCTKCHGGKKGPGGKPCGTCGGSGEITCTKCKGEGTITIKR